MSRRHYEVFIGARVEYFTTDALADDEGNESSRNLGLIVARGTLLVLVSPVDGSEEIENPFQAASED
jgi:U6 snRNA-associated Sm-like protein LSm7